MESLARGMSTDHPEWFGTPDPGDDDPSHGEETSRNWFEGMGFERTDPGTVERDDPSGELRTVVGADADAVVERSPTDAGTEETAQSGPAAGANTADADTANARPQAPSDDRSAEADPVGGESGDVESTTGGSLLARLKALLGL